MIVAAPLFVAAALTACGLSPPSNAPRDPRIELEGMDARVPVPLQPRMALHQKENMRDHLLVIQQVVDALGRDDWAGVESAATRFGSSPQMQTQCEHMGKGADGFTERALDFHERADAIVAAARQHDSAAVLRATSDTLSACTECHATYRQQLVTDADWSTLTAAKP